MNLTDKDIDMLIAGCKHYAHVYEDLGNIEKTKAYTDLWARLLSERRERQDWFGTSTFTN